MRRDPWVVRTRPRHAAQVRLFCLHHAGGAASSFGTWGDALPEWIEVAAVQLPGRESRFRESLPTDLTALSRSVADALAPQLDRPYAVFGHSLGGHLAFETLRRLNEAGQRMPAHMFVAGARAPCLPLARPPIHDLPDGAFEAEVRRFGGTPAEVLADRGLLELLLPILRADLRLHETHRHVPGPPLPVSATVFGGLEDPYVEPEALDAWRMVVGGPTTVRTLPGSHFFLRTERGAVLRAIVGDLQAAVARAAYA